MHNTLQEPLEVKVISSLQELEFKMNENWGSYGSWKDCPQYEFVTSFDLKIQSKQSGYWDDDLAMTGMRVRCERGTVLTSRTVARGSFRGYTDTCSSGFTAAKVRVQSHQVIECLPESVWVSKVFETHRSFMGLLTL